MTTGPGRRRGPRTDLDVRAHLVSVAERMFGEQGLDQVSARAVAREAGVAPSALAYHFPAGKPSLVRAVVDRRMELVGEAMRVRLLVLLDRGDEVHPAELVEAVLMPSVDMLRTDPDGGLRWMRIIGRLRLAEDPVWVQAVSGGPRLDEIVAQVAARVLPDLDRAEVLTRVSIAVYSVFALLVGLDQLAGTTAEALDDAFVAQLVRFAAAGIRG